MLLEPKLDDYLRSLTTVANPILLEMEELARNEQVPIIDRVSIQFLRLLLLQRPGINRILELGTAIGYSTIWFAEAAKAAVIDTIERDEQRLLQAKVFIEQSGYQDRIQLHHLDATEAFSAVAEHTYDFIFIDAAKGQYQRFFETFAPLLSQNGIIVTDNVLFHGELVKEHIEQRRIRSLVDKIKRYNAWLVNHPDFETSIVPIGDGLALTIHKRD